MGETENKPLPSHSVLERHFYLMILPCSHCGKGPLALVTTEQNPEQSVDIWFVRCKQCQQGRRMLFDRHSLVVDEVLNAVDSVPEVNPTAAPSQLIDAGQWLALFYSILSAASQEQDRKEAQRLGYEATLCLEEAMKFYQPDSDLPPVDSLWSETSRKSLKDRPELFLRQKLLQMREKLPSLQVMRNAISHEALDTPHSNGHSKAPKHWWSKWFKGK